MADAPWKGRVEIWWGADREGQARGFSWCSLCGTSCDLGVLARGPNGKGTAFFCYECVDRMSFVRPDAILSFGGEGQGIT